VELTSGQSEMRRGPGILFARAYKLPKGHRWVVEVWSRMSAARRTFGFYSPTTLS
jgi:hypothetical protein